MKFLVVFGKKLRKTGLQSSKSYEITIREPKGKWMGFFHHHRDDKKIDELCAKPEAFGNTDDLNYLFGHEHGHALWFNNMTAAWRAEWVKEFNRATALKKVTSDSLNDLRTGALAGPTLQAHYKGLDDNDKIAMREVYKYLHRIYDLDKQDLQDLIDDHNDLTELWPSKIELSDKTEIVSKYAMTNPKELWADSFAFYWQGQELPKRISRLMSKTIAAIKAGNGQADNDDEESESDNEKPAKKLKKLKKAA